MLPPRVLPNITNSQQYLLPNFTAFFRTYNHIYASKFGKLSNGHRTGKSQFSFQFKTTMPKDVETIAQLYSFHMLARMLKILQSKLQEHVNCDVPNVQSEFRKGRGTCGQIAKLCWIIKKGRVPEIHLHLLY